MLQVTCLLHQQKSYTRFVSTEAYIIMTDAVRLHLYTSFHRSTRWSARTTLTSVGSPAEFLSQWACSSFKGRPALSKVCNDQEPTGTPDLTQILFHRIQHHGLLIDVGSLWRIFRIPHYGRQDHRVQEDLETETRYREPTATV